MKTQMNIDRPESKLRGVRLEIESRAVEAPQRIRIRLSGHGIRQTLAARSSGFGFAIPGFAARQWFQ